MFDASKAAPRALAAAEREEDKSCLDRSRRWLRRLTVEPVLLLYSLGVCIGSPAAQQLIFSKYCDRAAATAAGGAGAPANGSSPATCADPGAAATDAASDQQRLLYEEAQRAASRMVLYCVVTLTLPQLAASAALGAWSDRGGRKRSVLVPLVGSAAGYGCWALLAWQTAWDPAYALLACFVQGATGYLAGHSLTAFSYLTAAAPAERRTFRVAIAEGAAAAGLLVGLFASGLAIERLGLAATFVVAAGVNALAAVYCAVWLDEIGPSSIAAAGHEARHPAGERRAGLRRRRASDWLGRPTEGGSPFRCGYGCFPLCERDGGGGPTAAYLYIALASYFIGYCATAGAGDLTYLYLTKVRGFASDLYGYYAAADVALKLTVGSAALALLRRVFGLGDLAVAAAGCASAAAAYATLGAAPWTWLIWASAPLDALQFAYSVGVRSFVSKLVAPSEQGRAFALLAAAQAGATIAAVLLFNNLYPATIGFYPGLSFVVASLLSAVAGLVLVAVAIHFRHSSSRCGGGSRRRAEYEELPGSSCSNAPAPPEAASWAVGDGLPAPQRA